MLFIVDISFFTVFVFYYIRNYYSTADSDQKLPVRTTSEVLITRQPVTRSWLKINATKITLN